MQGSFFSLLSPDNSTDMNQYAWQDACCVNAFSDFVLQCPETITIYTLNLTPSTTYRIMITSPVFGSVSIEADTDVDGYLVIDIDDLPPGFLVQYTGGFTLHVFPSTAGLSVSTCDPIDLLLARKYKQVQVDMQPGSAVKDTVGCPLP